ncbi:hypothetical protein EV360DRAFT_66953 [Lentinula raphanica]|nr:hypothetical protein EV360DRAFT_66953 [Lentinula raphanica]
MRSTTNQSPRRGCAPQKDYEMRTAGTTTRTIATRGRPRREDDRDERTTATRGRPRREDDRDERTTATRGRPRREDDRDERWRRLRRNEGNNVNQREDKARRTTRRRAQRGDEDKDTEAAVSPHELILSPSISVLSLSLSPPCSGWAWPLTTFTTFTPHLTSSISSPQQATHAQPLMLGKAALPVTGSNFPPVGDFLFQTHRLFLDVAGTTEHEAC